MNKYKIPILILVALLILTSTVVAYAQTGGGYDLSWWTVDGGGGTSQGGGYSLTGTIGQPEPGPASTGGSYNLLHGFWPSAGNIFYDIFLPLIIRK